MLRVVSVMEDNYEDNYVEALRAANESERRAALDALGGILRRALARSFGQKLGDSDLDDLVQESLVRIYTRLDSFEGQARFTSWATAIAVHCALSELRRRRYRHVQLEAAAAEVHASLTQAPPSSEDHYELRIARLRQGVAEALTARQREAMLAKLGGLPLMEIARRLETTQGAVYKLLHDARRSLKHYVAQAEAEPEGSNHPLAGRQ